MYKIVTVLTDEEKEKLEYICKRDKRKKNNMLSFLVDYYYRKTKKKDKEERGVVKKKVDKDYDLYQEALNIMGTVEWDGDISEMREDRNIDF